MMYLSERDVTFLDPVRAEIRGRIGVLRRELPRLSLREIVLRVDALRRFGRAHDLESVCVVAAGLGEAIGRDGRATIISTYLDILSEALTCESACPETGKALLAAVSVRFSS